MHPQTTLESARMIFEKHLKVFEPRFDRLFDSNDEPTGYIFDIKMNKLKNKWEVSKLIEQAKK